MADEIARAFGLASDAPRLEEALTHPSYANEIRSERDYQRLEFLGDAVLGLCTSELLCDRFPDADEGSLTRMRARLVNADALASWARRHGVAEAVRLGRGAEAGGLRDSMNVLADVVEALIGAAYLDGGLDTARRAVAAIVEPHLDSFARGAERDPKSALQERVQKQGEPPPVYAVVDSGGPAHAPWFAVEVRVGDAVVGAGRGGSKRLAEREAAEAALGRLESGEPIGERGETGDKEKHE